MTATHLQCLSAAQADASPVDSFITQHYTGWVRALPWIFHQWRPDLEELTRKEIEVLLQVMRGQSNQEIGRTLLIAPETVSTHLHHILQKLNVQSRIQAATLGLFLLLSRRLK